jgi:superfamily II DNA/RNA helicase
LTRDPQRITLSTARETHTQIEQRLHWADSLAHKMQLLEHLLADKDVDQAVVFTSTQRDADIVADRLAEIGHPVASLHGAMPQARRTRVLQAMRQRQLRILVATDVASRGIDVPTITHVINYGLPMKTEDYVHRIGRTGRAGRNGLAITLGERRDIGMIRRIEQFTTQPIKVSTIAGLEPKMAPPPRPDRNAHRPGSPRPQTGYGPKPGGKFAGRDQPRFNDRFNDRGGDRGGDRFSAPVPAHPFGPRPDAAPAFRAEQRPFAAAAAPGNDRGPGFNRGPRHDGPDNGPRGGFAGPRGPRRNDR